MTDDVPPELPDRCLNVLLFMAPEERRRMGGQWDAEEQRYIDWVRSHPSPRTEWLEQVKKLEDGRKLAKAITLQTLEQRRRELHRFVALPGPCPSPATEPDNG